MKSFLTSTLHFKVESATDDNWLATIYPSKDDLANNYHLGTYKALATCRQAGQYQLEINGWGGTGTYECDSTDDNWLTTIYPSKDDLANYYHLGPYKALATCRRAGQYQLEKNGWGETGTYECGLNCSLDVYADKKFICEDTAQ